MTDVISNLAQSLLALAIPVLAAYLATSLKKFLDAKIADMKANANTETQLLIDTAVGEAVKAAEQIYNGPGQGKTKLGYAVKLSTEYLAKLGVNLDLSLLTGLIEAEVYRAFNAEP